MEKKEIELKDWFENIEWGWVDKETRVENS